MTTPQSPRPVSVADESLSAFVDSQCDDLERRRVAARLLDDAAARAAFRRYELASAVLQGGPLLAARQADDDAAVLRLRNALALEPGWEAQPPDAAAASESAETPAIAALLTPSPAAVAEPPRSRNRAWYGAGLGLATAAGIAAGLLLGPGPATDAPSDQIAQVEAPAPPSGELVPAGGVDTRRLAHRYMLLHAQQSGFSQSAQGISFVKYLSLPTEGPR